MLVLKEVKDFMIIAKAMKMPEELVVEILSGEKEKIIENLSSFWISTRQTWNTLKQVLTQCGDMASAELAHLMLQYNRKGRYSLNQFCYKQLCSTLFNNT